MSASASALFFFCAVAALGGAVATCIARRPLRAAVGLLVHVIALAGLYLTLSSHLVATLQLLVYAGAVVVLFVFVILLIGPAGEVTNTSDKLLGRIFGGCAAGAVALMVAFSVARVELEWGPRPVDYGTVEGLGQALYQGALAPFEMVSITLTVAIVGAVAIARGRTAREKQAAADRKAARLAAETETA